MFDGRQSNLYVYVNNNSVNFTDPNGKIAPLALIAGGAAIGAVVSGGIYAATTDNFHGVDWQEQLQVERLQVESGQLQHQ